MASLFGVFAEFDRDLLRERVRAGLENARRKGKRPVRRPFFDMASLGTLGRLRDRGMSVRAIAREMKVSKSLVHKSLKNMNAQTQDNQGSREAEETVHE
jgi:DNA invertase Pin-like site-specific DNA recombinase